LVFPQRSNSPFDPVLDGRIAEAILRAQGDIKQTLRILEYPVDEMTDEQMREQAEELAARPGVRRFAQITLSEIEGEKDAILRRQLLIALYGEQGPSLQAAYFLADIMGWRAPKKTENTNTNQSVSYVGILKDDKLIAQAIALNHEPGEAIAITSEAREDESA
jgi:hypothetical protein